MLSLRGAQKVLEITDGDPRTPKLLVLQCQDRSAAAVRGPYVGLLWTRIDARHRC